MDAVQHVYRVYMAQIVGGDMRTNSSTNLATRQAPATGTYNTNTNTTKIGTRLSAIILDMTQTRVIQNSAEDHLAEYPRDDDRMSFARLEGPASCRQVAAA